MWDEISDTVKKNNEFAAKSAASDLCECGSPWQKLWESQALGYSPEEKCMCDFFIYRCTAHNHRDKSSCQKTKTVTVPLRGKAYKKMADEIEKSS